MDISRLTAEGLCTPPGQTGFFAKELFKDGGKIRDGAAAYIEPGGGLPENHTHDYNHIFIVVKGTINVTVGAQEKTLSENESLFVKGEIPHSIHNRSNETAQVIGITTVNDND